ncbi:MULTISPECIES: hypothetical protein [Marinobacter]|uniref:hypothetical protein n=1 Tax=Marinobacter TaxID=2742 RepID=UPI001247A6A4|nr:MULTISPECIES: hypothetical protein [Marinobacter]MBL3558878.1 hypothetical protein [Marinobacter sp. JB05H06]
MVQQEEYIKGVTDREELRSSLVILGALEPDVVISSAFLGPSGFMEGARVPGLGTWIKHFPHCDVLSTGGGRIPPG